MKVEYDNPMNMQTLSRILTGILILIAGLGGLLDALGVLPFWQYAATWWPLGVIIAGLLVIIADVRQYITTIVLVVVGVLLQLHTLNFIHVNVWGLIWPVIIIAVGLSVIVNKVGHGKNVKTRDLDSVAAIFSGSETANKSQNYKGGKVSSIFGGVKIDLRDARIDKEATIEVFVLCGGVELDIPREWKVQQRVTPILGGVESKSYSEKTTDKSPTLYITGMVALGGVEVKS